MNFPWTKDQVELAKEMWTSRESAATIAAALGGTLSRHAVVNKMHRLGLRGFGAPNNPRLRRALKPLAIRPLAVQHFQDNCGVAAFPASLNIPLIEITDKQCKWAPGEPMDGFCGHRNWGKTPYCQHHARLSYTPEGLRRLGL